MYDLSIVIPAYNEEKKIYRDIEAIYDYFRENFINGELIIVDDGSRDNTFNAASEFKNKYPTLKVLTYKQNRGKGYAVKTGILEASGKNILFADAGLCVPYKCVKLGIELLESGSDIAIGSRRTSETKIVQKQPLYRRLGSQIFHFLIKTFSVIPEGIQDTQCGFKLFKKEIAHKVFKRLFTEKFMWDIEMLRIAKKEKYKVGIFPVEWSNDPDTKFRPYIGSIENIIQILNIMIRT